MNDHELLLVIRKIVQSNTFDAVDLGYPSDPRELCGDLHKAGVFDALRGTEACPSGPHSPTKDRAGQ